VADLALRAQLVFFHGGLLLLVASHLLASYLLASYLLASHASGTRSIAREGQILA
jgi:hypothetical protein